MINITFKTIKGNIYIYVEGWREGKRFTKACGSIFNPKAWNMAYQLCRESGLTRKKFREKLIEYFHSLKDEQIKKIWFKLLDFYLIAKYPSIEKFEDLPPEEKEIMELFKQLTNIEMDVFLILIFEAFALNEKITMGELYHLAKIPRSPNLREVSAKEIVFWEITLQQENYEPQTFQFCEYYPVKPLKIYCSGCGTPLEINAINELINDTYYMKDISVTQFTLKGSIFCYNCIKTYNYMAIIEAKEPAQFLLDLKRLPKEEFLRKYPAVEKILKREGEKK